MGDLSIGKMHKLSTQNLCNLPIDKNAGRVGRARAARKTEKTPTLRSRSLIRKEVNIRRCWCGWWGVEPHDSLVSASFRQTAPTYLGELVLSNYVTYSLRGILCPTLQRPLVVTFLTFFAIKGCNIRKSFL